MNKYESSQSVSSIEATGGDEVRREGAWELECQEEHLTEKDKRIARDQRQSEVSPRRRAGSAVGDGVPRGWHREPPVLVSGERS